MSIECSVRCAVCRSPVVMSYEGDYLGDENRTRRDLAFVHFSAFIETVQKFGCRANDCGSHKFEPALYTETIE